MEQKMSPCISVIIPMYNVESYIKRCLDSVINQSYKNLEIILVDDGSPDNSGAIADEYAAKDGRIKVVHQENRGIACARNTGLREASGEWIAFVDSDDEIPTDTIKTLWKVAEKENVSISMGGYYVCIHHEEEVKKRQIHVHEQVIREPEKIYKYFLSKGKSFAFLWMKLYHRSVFENLAFPAGRCYEDIYLLPEIIDAAGNIAIIDIPIYYYHLRYDSLTFGSNMSNHMDGLYARLNWKSIMEEKYPQLLCYSADAILEFCCYLLGKITLLGRKELMPYWNQVVECFKQNQALAAKESLYLKVAVALFHISPVLLGKLCCAYSKIKNF